MKFALFQYCKFTAWIFGILILQNLFSLNFGYFNTTKNVYETIYGISILSKKATKNPPYFAARWSERSGYSDVHHKTSLEDYTKKGGLLWTEIVSSVWSLSKPYRKGVCKSEGESGTRTHITALTEQKMDCCMYQSIHLYVF